MIRIGIIGAGPNASGHGKYYSQSSRAKVVAVADPDKARADQLAAETGAKAVADYRDFLSDVDAVVVSSPNFLHKEQAIACAQAGKHVYCEKPMGLNLADARAVADAVNKAGVKSAIGFAVQWDPPIQTMLRMHREGKLGELISVVSRRLMYMKKPTGGWRADPKLSGGLLYEINIHEIDWMCALGGEVTSVYARTWAEKPAERANDHLWVTLNFGSGAVGLHEGSWSSPTPQFFRNCQGTRAGLTTDEWGSKLYHANAGENRSEIPPDPRFDNRGDWLDAIEKGADARADVNWGLKVMTVAEAILESGATGAPVEVKRN